MRIVVCLFGLLASSLAVPVARTSVDQDAVTGLLNQLVAADARTDSLVKLSYQNMASHKDFTHDNAPNPLFTSVDSTVPARPTFQALANLLVFYSNPSISKALTYDATWSAAITNFLNAVAQTPVMQQAQTFLVQQGLSSADLATFISQLRSLWFTPFSRAGGVAGSSGFSSVFAGEVDTNNNVIRFANWFRFHMLENASLLNYHGWFTKQNGIQIDLQFAWNTFTAMEQAFLLNTTPEFDLAVYTVCALTGGTCKFTVSTNEVDITVTTISAAGTTVIDQAIPTVGAAAAATTKKPTDTNDPQLQTLVDQMRAADVDKPAATDYTLDWGNKVSGTADTSPNPLFKKMNEAVFNRPVYQVLLDVFDGNYFIADVCKTEVAMSGQKKAKVQTCINTWMQTQVFQLAFNYLKQKGVKQASDQTTLANFLFNFWFGTYSRCTGNNGSSGWEHVFSGEWKSGTVDGQHDWTRYYFLEKADKINYHGYYSYDGQLTGTFQYTWESEMKKTGGFLFGTSPAFDFSLLTVCALVHPGDNTCKFTLDGYPLAVTSYTQSCDVGTCLSTAYPTN